MDLSYKTIDYYNALGEKVLENISLVRPHSVNFNMLIGTLRAAVYTPVFHYDFYSKVKSAGINDDRVLPYAVFAHEDFKGEISNYPLSINPNIKYRIETFCDILRICDTIYNFFSIAEDLIGGDCVRTDNLTVFTIDGFTAFLLMVFSYAEYAEEGIVDGLFGLYDVNDDDFSTPLFEIHEEKKYNLVFAEEE